MADDKTPASPHEAEPVRITDKREQRRLEAEAARIAREAEVERSKAEHPAGEGPLEDDTVLDVALARVDRIQVLRAKHGAEGGLTPEEGKELLRLQAEQEEADNEAAQEGRQQLTAFVVMIGHDGSVRASHDLNELLYIDREATTEDMFHGASVVVRDITAAITAQQTLFSLNIGAQAMQEKAAAINQARMLQGQSPGRRRR